MKIFNYFVAVILTICMVSCGEKVNLNEVTLKVEADLDELGNYLNVVDKEVTIKKADAEKDGKSGFAFKSSICVNVLKAVATDYSFCFDVKVLDKDHIEIGDINLPDYDIERSKFNWDNNYSDVLTAGKKYAVMDDFVSKDDWEAENQENWEKICKEGVYLIIKPNYDSAEYVAYSGSSSDETGIEVEEEEESGVSEDGDDEVSSSSDSEDWDALLDSYEKFVDKYISYMKKAASGDLSAISEYTSLMEKAEEIGDKLDKAGDDLSTSQMARYMKINEKMTKAAFEQ